MRRGQSSVEAVLAALLLAVVLSAAAATAARQWQAAHAALQTIARDTGVRRAQGVVEVVALAPVVTACAVAFALACGQLAAQGRAEAGLAAVVAADAAGAPAPTGLRITRRDGEVVVAVHGPLGDATAVTRP